MGESFPMIQVMACIVTVVVVGCCVGRSQGSSLTEQCSPAIQQLTSCLEFATGKGGDPSKECCQGISSMKDKQPVCLCFFIGQAHNGSQQFKSLGIQEAKLFQLPSACHLANANVSDCPKLLGISPTSTAAAIFKVNNASSPGATTMPTTTGSGDNSTGFKPHTTKYGLFAVLVAIVVSLIS